MSDSGKLTGIEAVGRKKRERLVHRLSSLEPTHRSVVHVDYASTNDGTEGAGALGALVADIDIGRPFTPARACAEGFARPRTDLPNLERMLFLDGDCELEDGFIEAANGLIDSFGAFAEVCAWRCKRVSDASHYNLLTDRERQTNVGEVAACSGDALYASDDHCASVRSDHHTLATNCPNCAPGFVPSDCGSCGSTNQ